VLKHSAICSAFLGVVLMIFAASDAAAQFHLSPGFGVYVPHGVPLLTENGASGTETLRKQAVGGPVFTTRAGFSLSRLAAVEASVSYSPALIAVHSASGHVEDRSAGLVLLSARSLFRLTPESTTRFSIHAASGVGMVTRIGNAWSDTPTKPAFALVLGAGAMAPLTPRGGTSFRIDLEDYLSFAQFELADGTRSKAHPYHDLVWSLGLSIPISKRSGR
jgi:hypothetical protein